MLPFPMDGLVLYDLPDPMPAKDTRLPGPLPLPLPLPPPLELLTVEERTEPPESGFSWLNRLDQLDPMDALELRRWWLGWPPTVTAPPTTEGGRRWCECEDEEAMEGGATTPSGCMGSAWCDEEEQEEEVAPELDVLCRKASVSVLLQEASGSGSGSGHCGTRLCMKSSPSADVE